MNLSNSPVRGWGLPLLADLYLDPDTGILRNLVGARTAEELARYESDLTTGRTVQVQANDLVVHSRDLAELRSIHRHLFQDIYGWAGEIRTIDMRRGAGQFFAPVAGIDTNAFHVFAALRECEYLQNLGQQRFVQELARFYDDLNFVHPFRDGNGRVQRLFWSRVSYQAGWILDWRPIHGDLLDEVSRVAREEGSRGDLESALSLCVSPA